MPLPFRYSTVPSLHGRDAGARSSIAMPRAAHPADGASATVKGCCLDPGVALLVCVHGRLGAVHWRASLRRVNTAPPTLSCTMSSTAACLSALVSLPPVTPPICRHSPWTGPLTLFHSRCIGPGASLCFRATSRTKKATPSPLLSLGVVDHVGEFRPSVARLPRCELELSIMSGECTVR
jgi:hypothetical protein